MAKIAGAIDATVKLLETVIAILPVFKYENAAGKEIPIRDLAGLARSVQAATSVRQGARIDESDVRSLEGRLAGVQSDADAMLAQLAKAAGR
jgi:predicted trehalose synthase